jgi:zeaxanthin glucosyltransferase
MHIMSKILIDILPALGHFNSSLKLVKMLQSAGHQVIYLNQGLKAELAKYGLSSCDTGFDIPPVLLQKGEAGLRMTFKNYFRPANPQKRIKIQEDLNEFKKFLKQLAPDLVLLDEQNMLKAIYYEICKVPVVCLQSKPDPLKSSNIPPFTSSFVPSTLLASRLYCELLWIIKTLRNHYRLKILQLNSKKTDIYSITLQIALQHDIDLKGRITLRRGYDVGVNGIPRFILSPAAFDFPHPAREGTWYIGPLIDINREQDIKIARYKVLLSRITSFKNQNSGFVVYCSLGSQNKSYLKKVERFFKRLMDVARKNPDDLFVISLGEELDVGQLFPVPDNLYAYRVRDLPQADLLRHCDIMITHGGCNSLTECIFREVPTLNYPLYWDQPGCAARVVYHKLGLKGSISRDSSRTISRKLNYLKLNHSQYKKNVLLMKTRFKKNNNSKEALEIIEGIIK